MYVYIHNITSICAISRRNKLEHSVPTKYDYTLFSIDVLELTAFSQFDAYAQTLP